MPTPVNSVSGPGVDRAPTGAEAVAEARLRQAERLRAAQAETTNPVEVVEPAEKTDPAEIAPRKAIQPYRVSLDGATGRLHTEVLDTETGAVIMRIPAGYAEPEDAAAADAPSDAASSGEIEA
ncbi:hypothetical protein [Azospirillum halopraeferens]|uniref:hypothetical protein n=1 Tax=Azospirillum halopraeferens TaxID=34010 RepID=UPI00041AB40A|nr:hypothetical protein [Azospirillum halopraeferens]